MMFEQIIMYCNMIKKIKKWVIFFLLKYLYDFLIYKYNNFLKELSREDYEQVSYNFTFLKNFIKLFFDLAIPRS